MYINFKSKYKKFLWLLIGFILSCIYVHKVSAYNYHDFVFDNNTLTTLFNTYYNTYEITDYPYVSITYQTYPRERYEIVYSNTVNNTVKNSDNASIGINNSSSYPSLYLYIAINNGQIQYLYKSTSTNYRVFYNDWPTNAPNYFISATNYNLVFQNNTYLYKSFDYSPNPLPDYLSGYTEITLEPGERYVIFSSSTITSGSVFIPIEDFNNYGSRISYFDKDTDTQPYTSYIQDFSTTPDGLYAKQSFDLSSYSGADFIMFSKYIYLEGQDNITSSVWVPSAMYSSIVEITPNNTGGNDFDFTYVDSNGELQADIISSSDLSQGSPLISDLFTNFTTKDYGLSSIITAPIPLLQSLNSTTCTNIELPIGSFGGVHDRKIILPCMNTFYHDTFGELYTLYQTIATGLTAYFVGLAYFNKIKQLKDPYDDKIEVVDL